MGAWFTSETNYEKTVITHYNNSEVQEEIAKFSQNRWVALHCEVHNPQGYPVLIRYRKGAGNAKEPLTITKPEDIPLLLKRFGHLKPRTFYASASVYSELTRQEHVKDISNILFCAPVWDIDNTPEKWKATIEATKEIVTFLRKEGVSKSVFLKWSGKGVHVHIHHRAFSPSLLQKIAPLDIAYTTVEYVNRKLSPTFAKVAETHGAQELSVENEIDLQRVFTCPLSLHRSLNSVAVCFSPASVSDFTPNWTRVNGFRHWKDWDKFETGEADALAESAYHSVGGYTVKTLQRIRLKEATNSIVKWLKNQ